MCWVFSLFFAHKQKHRPHTWGCTSSLIFETFGQCNFMASLCLPPPLVFWSFSEGGIAVGLVLLWCETSYTSPHPGGWEAGDGADNSSLLWWQRSLFHLDVFKHWERHLAQVIFPDSLGIVQGEFSWGHSSEDIFLSMHTEEILAATFYSSCVLCFEHIRLLGVRTTFRPARIHGLLDLV